MLWLTRRAALWSRSWSIGDVEGSWDLECDTAAIKLEAHSRSPAFSTDLQSPTQYI